MRAASAGSSSSPILMMRSFMCAAIVAHAEDAGATSRSGMVDDLDEPPPHAALDSAKASPVAARNLCIRSSSHGGARRSLGGAAGAERGGAAAERVLDRAAGVGGVAPRERGGGGG